MSMSEDKDAMDSTKSEEETKDKKNKSTKKNKKDKKPDPDRFRGAGVNFRAKLIGIESVAEARGDKMCQDAMQKVKAAVKAAGEHKQKILVNVSLEGLKILEEKSTVVLHHHAVHKISFISRDVNDSRAFGYVYGPGEGKHEFYGIKTDKPAEGLVLSLRDLFQVVFEMKKREVELQKQKHKDEETGSESSPATSVKTTESKEKENLYDGPMLIVKTRGLSITCDTHSDSGTSEGVPDHPEPRSDGSTRPSGLLRAEDTADEARVPSEENTDYESAHSQENTDYESAQSQEQAADTASPPATDPAGTAPADDKPSEPAVGDLLDLNTELSFLQQGIAQMNSVVEDTPPVTDTSAWATPWDTAPSNTSAAAAGAQFPVTFNSPMSPPQPVPGFQNDPFQTQPFLPPPPQQQQPQQMAMLSQPSSYNAPGFPATFPGQAFHAVQPAAAAADPFQSDPFFSKPPLQPVSNSSSSTAFSSSPALKNGSAASSDPFKALDAVGGNKPFVAKQDFFRSDSPSLNQLTSSRENLSATPPTSDPFKPFPVSDPFASQPSYPEHAPSPHAPQASHGSPRPERSLSSNEAPQYPSQGATRYSHYAVPPGSPRLVAGAQHSPQLASHYPQVAPPEMSHYATLPRPHQPPPNTSAPHVPLQVALPRPSASFQYATLPRNTQLSMFTTDPFDSSALARHSHNGPYYDPGNRKPQPHESPHTYKPGSLAVRACSATRHRTDSGGSADDFSLPSPEAPPPPLPRQCTVDVAEPAPAPPPRPVLMRAKTIDVPMESAPALPPRPGSRPRLSSLHSIDTPPPLLTRPDWPSDTPDSSHRASPAQDTAFFQTSFGQERSSEFFRTSFSQDMFRSSSRSSSTSSPLPQTTSSPFTQTTSSPLPPSSTPPLPPKASHSAVAGSHSRQSPIPIPRPRPRPRPRTPASSSPSSLTLGSLPETCPSPVHDAFTRDSVARSSDKVDSQMAARRVGAMNRPLVRNQSEPYMSAGDMVAQEYFNGDLTRNGSDSSMNRRHATDSDGHSDRSSEFSSSVGAQSVQNSFKDTFKVDPFIITPTDPFATTPSSDPFNSDFTQQAEVFKTKAVTCDPEPDVFGGIDPFADDPFATGRCSAPPEDQFTVGRDHFSSGPSSAPPVPTSQASHTFNSDLAQAFSRLSAINTAPSPAPSMTSQMAPSPTPFTASRLPPSPPPSVSSETAPSPPPRPYNQAPPHPAAPSAGQGPLSLAMQPQVPPYPASFKPHGSQSQVPPSLPPRALDKKPANPAQLNTCQVVPSSALVSQQFAHVPTSVTDQKPPTLPPRTVILPEPSAAPMTSQVAPSITNPVVSQAAFMVSEAPPIPSGMAPMVSESAPVQCEGVTAVSESSTSVSEADDNVTEAVSTPPLAVRQLQPSPPTSSSSHASPISPPSGHTVSSPSYSTASQATPSPTPPSVPERKLSSTSNSVYTTANSSASSTLSSTLEPKSHVSFAPDWQNCDDSSSGSDTHDPFATDFATPYLAKPDEDLRAELEKAEQTATNHHNGDTVHDKPGRDSPHVNQIDRGSPHYSSLTDPSSPHPSLPAKATSYFSHPVPVAHLDRSLSYSAPPDHMVPYGTPPERMASYSSHVDRSSAYTDALGRSSPYASQLDGRVAYPTSPNPATAGYPVQMPMYQNVPDQAGHYPHERALVYANQLDRNSPYSLPSDRSSPYPGAAYPHPTGAAMPYTHQQPYSGSYDRAGPYQMDRASPYASQYERAGALATQHDPNAAYAVQPGMNSPYLRRADRTAAYVHAPDRAVYTHQLDRTVYTHQTDRTAFINQTERTVYAAQPDRTANYLRQTDRAAPYVNPADRHSPYLTQAADPNDRTVQNQPPSGIFHRPDSYAVTGSHTLPNQPTYGYPSQVAYGHQSDPYVRPPLAVYNPPGGGYPVASNGVVDGSSCAHPGPQQLAASLNPFKLEAQDKPSPANPSLWLATTRDSSEC